MLLYTQYTLSSVIHTLYLATLQLEVCALPSAIERDQDRYISPQEFQTSLGSTVNYRRVKCKPSVLPQTGLYSTFIVLHQNVGSATFVRPGVRIKQPAFARYWIFTLLPVSAGLKEEYIACSSRRRQKIFKILRLKNIDTYTYICPFVT